MKEKIMNNLGALSIKNAKYFMNLAKENGNPNKYFDYVFEEYGFEDIDNSHRIYLPVANDEEVATKNVESAVYRAIQSFLKMNYEIEWDDDFPISHYIQGYFEQKKNGKTQKVKIGKFLQKKGELDLLKRFNEDSTRSLSKQGKSGKLAVISRHPYDIAGMSTDRGWHSCMTAGQGRIHSAKKQKNDIKVNIVNENRADYSTDGLKDLTIETTDIFFWFKHLVLEDYGKENYLLKLHKLGDLLKMTGLHYKFNRNDFHNRLKQSISKTKEKIDFELFQDIFYDMMNSRCQEALDLFQKYDSIERIYEMGEKDVPFSYEVKVATFNNNVDLAFLDNFTITIKEVLPESEEYSIYFKSKNELFDKDYIEALEGECSGKSFNDALVYIFSDIISLVLDWEDYYHGESVKYGTNGKTGIYQRNKYLNEDGIVEYLKRFLIEEDDLNKVEDISYSLLVAIDESFKNKYKSQKIDYSRHIKLDFKNNQTVITINNNLVFLNIPNVDMIVDEKNAFNLLKYITLLPFHFIGQNVFANEWRTALNLREDDNFQKAGCNVHYVDRDLKYPQLIAYFIDEDDGNIEHPLGRVLIRPFYYGNRGIFFSMPYELDFSKKQYRYRTYGTVSKEFLKTVNKFISESLNIGVENGSYKLPNELYNDGVVELQVIDSNDIVQVAPEGYKSYDMVLTLNDNLSGLLSGIDHKRSVLMGLLR